MHRHQYTGRKLSRTRDARRALLKGLATQLVLHEQLTTTKAKAKETLSYTERLISKAKQGSLHARRQLRSKLATEAATAKLVDELGPRFSGRTSGFIRLKPVGYRQGDDAQLATLSFTEQAPAKAPTKAKKATKKPATKPKTAKPAGVKK